MNENLPKNKLIYKIKGIKLKDISINNTTSINKHLFIN